MAAIGVRRSCETADRIADRSSPALASEAAVDASACELLELERGGELAPERLEDPDLVRAGIRVGHGQNVRVVEAQRESGGIGIFRSAQPRGALDQPAVLLPMEHGRALEPERPHQRVEHRRNRRRACEAHERLRLRPCSRTLHGPASRERDEQAHHDRDGKEDEQRQDVLRLADRERVERRREVPVDEQEAGDGGRKRRPEPTERRDADHEEEEQEQDARQPELVAQACEDSRQEGERDSRCEEAEHHAAAGERCGPTSAREHELCVDLARMADDVDVDADAGIGDHAVDHGAAEQLAEPRPPASPPGRPASR